MITWGDVLAARHGSNFDDVLISYLEPSNLYAVLDEEHDKAHEAYLLAEADKRDAELKAQGQQAPGSQQEQQQQA